MNVPRFIRRIFRAPFDGLRHHGVVEEGVLYRCGQPTPEQLIRLFEQHALRTVVSLRGARDEEDPDAWETDERRVCEVHQVQFLTLPCNHKNPPSSDQIEQFLALTRDPARRPVLVHCRLGQQRTLLFCALHRVHNQGVAAPDALREMDDLGFNIRHRRHQLLLDAFHRFAADPALRAPSKH